MNNKVLFPFIALCLMWGSTWYFIEITLNSTQIDGGTAPIAFVVGMRFLPSGLLFFLYLLLTKQSIPINKQAMKLYLSFGLMNFTLSYGISYWATQYQYSSISAILWGLFPLFTSVMAHFMIKDDPNERLTQSKIIALISGFIGILLISIGYLEPGEADKAFVILALVAVIIIAAYPSVLYKKHADVIGPYQMNAVCQTMTGIVMLSLSFFIKEDISAIVWTQELVVSTVYLVVVGGVLSWGIYFWLYQRLTVTQVTCVAIFPPIVAIIIGRLFLNEDLTIEQMIGTAFILGSAVLIYRK